MSNRAGAMGRRTMIRQYIKAYRWSDMLAMARNNKADPEQCSDDFAGRLVVITGATSGIGYATARAYAGHGADLLCINRNAEKSRAVCEEMERDFGVRYRDIIADLSRLDDMHRVGRRLAQLDEPIDVLIHNAGTYLTRRVETTDGLDTVFAVNHLSSFVINNLILDKLRDQSRGRVLLVNSEAHRFAPWGLHLDDLNWRRHRYSGLRSYGSAKMAQLLAMLRFNELLDGSSVTINAVHPGAVRTESGKENGRLYRWYKSNILERKFRSAAISADALYYLGVSAEVEGISGRFFNLTTLENPAPPALDKAAAGELWEISRELGRLDDPQLPPCDLGSPVGSPEPLANRRDLRLVHHQDEHGDKRKNSRRRNPQAQPEEPHELRRQHLGFGVSIGDEPLDPVLRGDITSNPDQPGEEEQRERQREPTDLPDAAKNDAEHDTGRD